MSTVIFDEKNTRNISHSFIMKMMNEKKGEEYLMNEKKGEEYLAVH